MGVRVSRWTLPYFAAALTCFATAQVVLALGWAYPVAGLSAPATLATVHLLTIGWLSLLILGALQQFVAVITGRSLASDTAAAWALGLVASGLAGMVVGFLSLSGGPLAGVSTGVSGPVPPPVGAEQAVAPAGSGGPLAVALPLGGTLVLTGFAVATVNLAIGLWRARPLVLPARFVAVGLIFLLLTGGLGVLLAWILAHPQGAVRHLGAPLVARLLQRGLPLHMVAGIGGWFTLTAMGVAYKLLSMFTLAPEDRGLAGRWVLRLSATGLLLAWLGGLAHLLLAATADGTAAGIGAAGEGLAGLTQVLSGLATAGWVAAGVGVVIYLCDMRRLYRQRRRKVLELNARCAPWAFGALAVAMGMLAAGALTGRLAAVTPALAYLLLFGWLSGLGLTQLYKIVPFLTWLEKFGPRLGRGPAVRVQDLVNERRAQPWFRLYFAAVAVATVAILAGWDDLWRAMTALTLASTLAIALELWRARRAEPRPHGAPVPPPWLGERGRTGASTAGTIPRPDPRTAAGEGFPGQPVGKRAGASRPAGGRWTAWPNPWSPRMTSGKR